MGFNFIKNIFKKDDCFDYNSVKLDYKKTSKLIKKLRKEYGYSQYTLASKIKVTRQAVSKWERGITIPSRETLIKLSNLFDMTINELLKQGDEK